MMELCFGWAYCTPPAGCLLVGWCWWSFVIFVAVVVWVSVA